ncbi:hypothetical protein AAFF_G00315680 [Aldrovandia affinis]|uniref:Uncharacterized protein n=1 Tax=Aldrovandia affinis TaxID=143900 RepID=A0AAD7SNV0_9TELE|nr:hypothetical protein AAFF_G00315680 [Aldrovandia affinis]
MCSGAENLCFGWMAQRLAGLRLSTLQTMTGHLTAPLNIHPWMQKMILTSSPLSKRLQRENAKLKIELEDLWAQYLQLLEEEKEEMFDERRVNLLKAQVMQLERQVVLLSEGLSSQMSRCLEVENVLEPLTDRLRSLLSMDSPSAEVSIARAELIQLIEMCADVRQKLHRSNKVTAVENLSMPWVLSKRNLVKQPVTLVDLCYGKTNNVNLQQVSALESRLSQLFKHLHGMRQTLGFILAPGPNPCDQARQMLTPSVYARLVNQATQCSRVVDHCCSDLLTLSLIVPSAPWAGTDQRVTQELSVDGVLTLLPAFPRGAPQQRARRAAEALVRATNYSRMMAMQQVEALQVELDFHRSLYSLQVRYTEGLLQAIRQAYQAFQKNVAQTLCLPLQDVLSSYQGLKSTGSEAALRDFLTAFKNNSERIQEAAEAHDPSKNQGDEALSRYGKDFFCSVEHLLKECAEQRDRAAGELQSLRSEHEEACESLRALRKERREKRATPSPGSDPPEMKGAEGGGPQPPDPASDAMPDMPPDALPKPKQSTSGKASSADSISTASETGPSQQPRVTQRPANQRRGKSPLGGESRKIPPRLPWQS